MRQRGDYNMRTAVLYSYECSMCVLQSRVSRSRCSIHILYLGHRPCTHQTDYRIRGTGICFARKNSLLAGTTSLHVVQAEQRLYHATGEAKRTFPTHKSRQLLCPKPKVMPRFSLGDVGEARWPLSHRWTETSPLLPDVAHDSRNQGRVASLSAFSLR